MKKEISEVYQLPFPDFEIVENFTFNVSTPKGVISLAFKWLNERWNCWVTLPNGEQREAGIYPNVTSWSGFLDYGFFCKTSLSKIDFNSINMTELYLIIWA